MRRGLGILLVMVSGCGIGFVASEEMYFTKYANASVTGTYAPLETVTVSARRACNLRCVRRAGCMAVAVSGSSCTLYDNQICQPSQELQSQPGADVYTKRCEAYVLSLSLGISDYVNAGNANFFPQLASSIGGIVVGWQVRCVVEGAVWLAMWRPVPGTTNSITLIGKHRIDVPADMVLQLVEYTAPEEDKFVIQAGDYVGFHYDSTIPSARVVYDDDPALHKEEAFHATGKDDAFPVGVEITTSPFPSEPTNRAPVLAVHIQPV